jgi:hypothetical protein
MAKKRISEKTLVARDPDMLASEMDGEKVMMSIERGEYYGLDETGSRVWDLIENETRVGDIVVQLLEEFDVDRDECARDVMEFLEELKQKGLITTSDDPENSKV